MLTKVGLCFLDSLVIKQTFEFQFNFSDTNFRKHTYVSRYFKQTPRNFKVFIMTTYNLVRQAILNKQCVTCFYNGYLRKMTPHVLGIKNGKQQALFYQYGGQSSSGLNAEPTKNWRCIPIDKIEHIQTNYDSFQTANNHSRTQTCVDTIDVEIGY